MRFWRDGLGLTELFDHSFTGDWPELFGAKTDRLRSIFLGDPRTPDAGIVELVVFDGADDAPAPPERPRHGFFLLSLQCFLPLRGGREDQQRCEGLQGLSGLPRERRQCRTCREQATRRLGFAPSSDRRDRTAIEEG